MKSKATFGISERKGIFIFQGGRHREEIDLLRKGIEAEISYEIFQTVNSEVGTNLPK